MKLTGRDAARFLLRPNPKAAGILLFGTDAMRVALKRAALVEALIGPAGAAEMRLERIAASDLRREPALALDALKATGFFPGPRAVLVEDAADATTPPLLSALAAWGPGDATLVVTAGNLTPGSALRKGFEAAKAAVAIGVYDDPPGRDEIEAALAKAGLARADRDATAAVEVLAHSLDPGDFGQFVEKLGLYKRGDPAPLSAADVEACAPPAAEAAAEALVALAADGEAGPLAAAFHTIGGSPTSLTIAAARYFRTLHAAASSPDGVDAALARARPPVFGPRRARMAAQARALGSRRLECALVLIVDAELTVRSSRPVPAAAVVEQLLIRLATLRSSRD
jgi:DNA polymerase III subunit delta